MASARLRGLRPTGNDMAENELARFRREVDIVTGALLAIAPERPSWKPVELYELVEERTGITSGPAQMYALCELCNPEHDGRLEIDSHMRVFTPFPGAEPVGVEPDKQVRGGPS